MRSLPDIHQGIVPLLIPTPVKIGIQFRIRKLRSGIVFDTERFRETKYACRRLRSPSFTLSIPLPPTYPLTGKILFPASILFFIKRLPVHCFHPDTVQRSADSLNCHFHKFPKLVPFILFQCPYSFFIKRIGLSINCLLTFSHNKGLWIKISPVSSLICNPARTGHTPCPDRNNTIFP